MSWARTRRVDVAFTGGDDRSLHEDVSKTNRNQVHQKGNSTTATYCCE